MIASMVGTVVLIYALVVAGAYGLQRRLMYFPDATRIAPAELGIVGVEEIEIERPDGVRLVAWYKAPDEGRPNLLYFHGNGGSVASRGARVAHWARLGYGLLFLNYRSYGGSGGSPSETALIADGGAAYDELVRRGVDPRTIVFYGESLGSGVAVQVAATREALAMILDAPFTSAVDVAARAYPFLPVRLLLQDRYMSIDHIGNIAVPVMIIHGEEDTVVPFALGERLFSAAREPKTFLAVAGTGHNDLDTAENRAAVRQFIEDALENGGP
jgi:hypothetical protein